VLSRSDVSEKQKLHKNIAGDRSSQACAVMTFEEAIRKCQAYINRTASTFYRQLEDIKEKRHLTEKYIYEYVDYEKPDVIGYETFATLKEDLVEEIIQYGPITEAMENPEIDEIRANAFDQIFIEKKGKTFRFEKNFLNKEHMDKVVTKLIRASKQRLTPKNPIVNARTIEGARVNATHSSISPYQNTAFVIRKFKKFVFTPQELIESKTFSVNMFRLLSLIPKADLSWMSVGSTGSGKTTLNELLVKEIDPLCRIITIENPSELRLLRYKNHESDEVINDVLQYEIVGDDKEDEMVVTMEQMLVNAMRQSPYWVGPGELRSPREFTIALRAAQTGHHLFTTLHSEGDEAAIYRFLTAYLSVSNEPAELALRNICAAIKFVVFLERLADGERRVTSISEIVGSEGLQPIIQPIYRFECLDVEEDSETKRVKKIVGIHKRVGKISEKTAQKILKAGIKKERFEFLIKDVNPSEEESYDFGIISDDI
jgi:pilus assembly protein CpaF